MRNDLQHYQLYPHSTRVHTYIKPHPALRKWVAHYTYLYNTKRMSSSFLTLVPDAAGCITMRDVGKGLECMFWGATTRCVQVPSYQETIRFQFFIEFHPTAAFALFHHSQHGYLNEQIALHEVNKQLNLHFQQAFEQCQLLSSFVAVIDQELLQLAKETTTCVSFMRKQLQKGSSIIETMNQTGYSRRHLQRMFLEQMGCSMKEYQRVERVNQAVQYLQQGMDGTRAAQLCGFYDQPHFIHDFTQICGLTPKKYMEKLSEFYNEPLKF